MVLFTEKYKWGKRMFKSPFHKDALKKTALEITKTPLRTTIINFLLQSLNKQETTYLEIGVRIPEENFNQINASNKYSVDPGVEFKKNPVDFKITSDEFFEQLYEGKILNKNIQFDIIFIDGLHLAEQVERDIANGLKYLNDGGFIILHDCNPPTELNARESYFCRISPVMDYWNGTAWKAFFKYRKNPAVFSCCVDTDWGIGIISKDVNLGKTSTVENSYFEFNVMDENRKESMNLISFEELKQKIES